jgi:hypothetical protein
VLGFFKPKLPIDQDEFDWLLACFKWFGKEFGGLEAMRTTQLVVPDAAFFPAVSAKGHALAAHYFDHTKTLAGMADWQCDLIEGASEREWRVSAGLGLRHLTKSPPLGSFGYQNGRYQITYNPAELDRPESLIATFAHELAHYLIHTASTRPPGGTALGEHATDVTAVFMGFGVFMANTAKSFEQFQNFEEQGWQMRPQGYLSELALVTSLAIFVRLAQSDGEAARAHLKDYLRKPFNRALNAIDRLHPNLMLSVSQIDLADWA